MKKGLIFATALAMVLGVGAAVGAHQVQVLRTKAATETTVYYAVSSSVVGTYTVKLNVNLKGDGDEWHQYTMVKETDTYDSKDVYSYTYTDLYNGVGVMQFQLYDGEDWVSEQKPINSWTSASVYNGKVYVHNDGWYTYTPDTPDTSIYKYQLNSGTWVTMTPGDNNQVVSASINFDKGDSLAFKKDDVALVVTPKDSQQLTKVYALNNKLVFAEDYSGSIYLNKSDNTLWAGQFTPGYYLAGVGGEWNPKLAVAAELENGTGPAYLVENIHLNANTEVKFIEMPSSGNTVSWFKVDTSKLTVGEGITASRVTSEDDGDGNLKVETAGDYNLYYTPSNGWYSIHEYQAPAADPVYTMTFSGSTITFDPDDEHKPEGSLHQYKATIPEYAWRARTLEFFKDGVAITTNIGVDRDEHNEIIPGNNIWGDSTNGFKIYSSNYYGMDVYLKEYAGGYSLWGTGYDELSFQSYVIDENGDIETVNLALDNTYPANETYIKQFKSSSAVTIKALAGTSWDNSNDLRCDGVSEDINFEAGNNNARQAFQVTAWKVHNDCTEVIYVKMKADLSLWMYVGGYEDAHVLTIGGQTINMEPCEDNQYRALGVSLHAGDEVTSYTIEGNEVQDLSAKVVGNNNLNANLEVIADATADIYYSVTNHTLHISGLPTGGYHIYKNNSTIIQMTHTAEYEGFDQYKSELLTFAVNDTIQFIDTDGDEGVRAAVIFNIGIINAGGLGANFEVVRDEHDDPLYIRCKTACNVAVYMKLKTGVDEVYFGQVEEYYEEAKDFADGFETAMAAACAAQDKQDAVEEAWALQATAFSQLSNQAKAALKEEGSSVLEIRNFQERYIAIKQQHSTWDLDNFLDITIPPSGRIATIFDTIITSESSVAIIIVAIAVVSFASLAVYLVIKKRKHQ